MGRMNEKKLGGKFLTMFCLALLTVSTGVCVSSSTGDKNNPTHMCDVSSTQIRFTEPNDELTNWFSASMGSNQNSCYELSDTFEDGNYNGWSVDDSSCGADTGIMSGSPDCHNDEGGARGHCPRPYGTYMLEITGDDRATYNLDLSGYSNVEIEYSLAGQSMDDSSEFAHLLFYDGSSWHILDEVGNNVATDQKIPTYSYQIPDNWLSSDNRIQLDLISGGSGDIHSGGNGCGDHGFVDTVIVKTGKTEVWTKGAFDYCPTEGGYDAVMRSDAQGEPYEVEQSPLFSNIYNVDYDIKSWCGCGDAKSSNPYTWLYDSNTVNYNNIESGEVGCCENDHVLYYGFEEGNGNPSDVWNTNDGTFYGGAEKREVSTTNYNGDTGAYFDGTEARIEIPDSDFLDLRRRFSIGMWLMTL